MIPTFRHYQYLALLPEEVLRIASVKNLLQDRIDRRSAHMATRSARRQLLQSLVKALTLRSRPTAMSANRLLSIGLVLRKYLNLLILISKHRTLHIRRAPTRLVSVKLIIQWAKVKHIP